MTIRLRTLAACALLFGCNTEDNRPPAHVGVEDADVADAGMQLADSSFVDANVDGGVDASTRTDGGPLRTCVLREEDHIPLAEYGVFEDSPVLAVRNDGMVIAWVMAIDGKARVSVQWIPADEGQHNGTTVTANDSNQRNPAMVVTDTGYLVVWRDDVDGDFDLASSIVRFDGGAATEPTALTVNVVDDGVPALARASNGEVLVAWTQATGETMAGKTLRLGADGAALAAAETVSAMASNVRPAVVALSSSWALTWAASENVQWQPLTELGAVDGALRQANIDPGATGAVSTVFGAVRGALAYDVRLGGVRAEVRLRTFSSTGEFTSSEKVLTVQPEDGVASAITPFGPGYAFTYYSEVDRVVRLAFVDEHGERLESALDLGESTIVPSATTLGVSPNGERIFVAWNAGSELHVTRVRCE